MLYAEKQVREQTACPNPECSSSDAFTIYDHSDGKVDGYCFSCGYYTHEPYVVDRGEQENKQEPKQITSGLGFEEALSHPVRALPERGISYATAEHFGVRVGVSTTDGETPIYHLYPRHSGGKLCGFKKRTLSDKSFQCLGQTGSTVDLFGSSLVKPQGKKIWITEGEIDAMSVYQALKEESTMPDWEPPVVSLPDGAASAVKAISNSLELLNGYEEVILVFDNDPVGQKARDAICKVLAGKVSYVDLPMKDANEMLMAGKRSQLKWAVLSHTKKYQPDGVVNAKDAWERYKNAKHTECFAYPSFLPQLNDMTYGVRPGSIVTITSGSGCGKTQFMRELMYHYYETTNEKLAVMSLEEDVGDTAAGLLSLHLNKRITLPNVEVSQESEEQAFKHLFDSGRWGMYDHFGGMDDDSLFNTLRYFAATGHRFMFLDHLSIIVSEYAAKGGERERIDTIMTKLAKFVKEFGVVLFLIVHLRKTENGQSFETGATPTLDSLRGSGSLKQLSWDVLGLTRNQQHPDQYCRNVIELSSLKCRFTGRTGVADYIYFNEETGRMIHIDKPANFHISNRSKKHLGSEDTREDAPF